MMPRARSTGPSRDFRDGWIWLVSHAISRVYLTVMLALVVIALVPLPFGASASVVQSGSMRPHIAQGDVVLAQPYRQSDPVPIGRVVTFDAAPGSQHPGLMLHRIVGTRPDGSLITKGDANADADSAPLAREQILGRAFLLVQFIGLPSFWLSHGQALPFSLWVLVSAAALAVQILTFTRRHRGTGPGSRSAPVDEFPVHPSRATTAGAAVAAVALLGGVAALILVASPVLAAFTAKTVSSGSVWAMPISAVPAKLAFLTAPTGSTGGATFSAQPVVAVQSTLGGATTSTAPVTLTITTPGGATLTCTANPVAAVSGTVTFSGCAIDKAGTYTLTATTPGLTTATSAAFTVAVGQASQLGFTATPGSTARATNFAIQPAVAVIDAGGNRVTSSTIPVSLSLTVPGGATLSCTSNPKSAVAGLATFSGCRVSQAGSYTLTATSGSLSPAVSTAFTIYGTATKLSFTTSPGGSPSSAAFTAQPVVAIQDAAGFTTAATNAVLLSITTPNGATLSCTTNPKNAIAGVAAFSGCSIGKAGTYTLRATSTGLTAATSASFTITPGSASRMTFTTPPSDATSSAAFATQPVVAVTDTFGNPVTAAVTLAITTPAGAALSCASNPVSATVSGAVFSGCAINLVGTYTLTASSPGVTAVVSSSFTISPGSAALLVFSTSPTGALHGVTFAVQPVVTVTDAAGNTVNSGNSSVTLAITPPAGGAVLSCTSNPRTANNGLATFSGCRIDRAGSYSLTATSASLGAATSNVFVIG